MQVIYDSKPLTEIEAAAARERAKILKNEYLWGAPALTFVNDYPRGGDNNCSSGVISARRAQRIAQLKKLLQQT